MHLISRNGSFPCKTESAFHLDFFPILIILARLSSSPPAPVLLLPSALPASQKRQSLLQSEGERTMLPCPGGFTQRSVGDKHCCVAPRQAVLSWESLSWAAHVAQSVFIDGNARSRRAGSSTESFRGCNPWHSLTVASFCIHFSCVGGFFSLLTFFFFLSFSFFPFFYSLCVCFFKAYVATSTFLATIDGFIPLIALPYWNTQCRVPQHSSAFVCKAECLAQRNVSACLHSPLGLPCYCKALQS